MQTQNISIKSLNKVPLPIELPPIMITVFTRSDLLKVTLQAIEKQTLLPRKIFGFIDAGRNEKDKIYTQECINLFQELGKNFDVEIIVRPKNLGCHFNTLNGITEVLNKYPAIVFLEDDVVPNIYFYDRICRLLEAYKDEKKVFSVNGYATLPEGINETIEEDFMISNRFFSWGFATWADRWHSLDIKKIEQSYNPFGTFYNIPLNCQTKLTMTNQFYLEKTNKTDWVITVTLNSLYQGYVHVTPMYSMVRNIGFGHPASDTYKGGEPEWVNCAYIDSFNPDRLPLNVELIDQIKKPLTELEIIEFITKRNLYLNRKEFWHLLQKYQSFAFKFALVKLFLNQQIKRKFK